MSLLVCCKILASDLFLLSLMICQNFENWKFRMFLSSEIWDTKSWENFENFQSPPWEKNFQKFFLRIICGGIYSFSQTYNAAYTFYHRLTRKNLGVDTYDPYGTWNRFLKFSKILIKDIERALRYLKLVFY